MIIEIDGSIHDEVEVKERDIERQKNLEAQGIYFLRFTNEQVEKHLEIVIKEIETFIANYKPL